MNILPKPTGPFCVGTSTNKLVDKTRLESHDFGSKFRELRVDFWYPADRPNNKTSLYISNTLQSYINKKLEDKAVLTTGLGYVNGSVITNSYLNTPISSTKKKFPVIIFSHGFTCPVYLYTNFFEELASYGFIIVAINHTYAADPIEFPDEHITTMANSWHILFEKNDLTDIDEAANKEISIWMCDVKFILDSLEDINYKIFKNSLDLNNIGMFGHSFGGGTTAQICFSDTRVKLGINLDGPIYGPEITVDKQKPFMFLLSKVFYEHYYMNEKDLSAARLTKQEAEKKFNFWRLNNNNLFAQLNKNGYKIIFNNAQHLSFSDHPLFLNESLEQKDQIKILFQIRKLLVYFFNNFLK